MKIFPMLLLTAVLSAAAMSPEEFNRNQAKVLWQWDFSIERHRGTFEYVDSPFFGKSSVLRLATPPNRDNMVVRLSGEVSGLTPGKRYLLSFLVKISGIDNSKSKEGFRMLVCSKDNRHLTATGPAGLWKWSTGTGDWTRCESSFTAPPDGIVFVVPSLRSDAESSVEIAELKIIPEDSTTGTQKKDSKAAIELFPANLRKGRRLEFPERQPVTLSLETPKKIEMNGKGASLTLILPESLRLVEAVESRSASPGTPQVIFPFTTVEHTVGKITSTEYRISIPSDAALHFANLWVKIYLILEARPGTRGTHGTFFWSADFNGAMASRMRGEAFTVLPAPEFPASPCREFAVMSVRWDGGPAGEVPKKQMLDYWSRLSSIRHVSLPQYGQPEPGYRNDFMFHGTVPSSYALPDSIRALRKLIDEKIPMQTSPAGELKNPFNISTAYALDDPEKKIEHYWRMTLRELKTKYPGIRTMIWDFEPRQWGYGEYCRSRFAGVMKRTKVPTVAELENKEANGWYHYMVDVHAQLVKKMADIAREELPGTKFVLCSDNLLAKAPHISSWCAMDVRKCDAAVDLHLHMPYYCGKAFFDDVRFNVENLKKPFFPLIDPSERLAYFFDKYTASGVTQNIVAAAALGSVGIGFWPDEALPGEYFNAIASGFATVSEFEQFYRKGERADSSVRVIPRNACVYHVEGDDGKPRTITLPDFARDLRFTVHRLNGEALLTCFNYNGKSSVIAEVSGSVFPRNFLLEIPPSGVVAATLRNLPDQNALKEKLARCTARTQSDFQPGIREGKVSANWAVNVSEIPVMRLSNGMYSADFDAAGTGELIAFRNNGGTDFLSGGFAGRISFSSAGRPEVHHSTPEVKIVGGNPVLSIRSTVAGENSADDSSAESIPDGLEFTRKFVLNGNSVEVSMEFFNPTSSPKRFGFRCGNLPMPGARFNRPEFQTLLDGKGVPLTDSGDLIALKQGGKKPGFAAEATILPWDGKTVISEGGDRNMKDRAAFTPRTEFDGVYLWNSRTEQTVEFFRTECVLAPGARLKAEYSIDFSTQPPLNKEHK